MPLLLRRRQEPKSAKRMWPFMSSRMLSGLTSLKDGGREKALISVHVFRHMLRCTPACVHAHTYSCRLCVHVGVSEGQC